MSSLFIIFGIIFIFAAGWWVRNPETSPWNRRRWKGSLLFVFFLTLGTWLFWLNADPLMMMAAFFMPHITLGIPVGIGVLLAVICYLEPEAKALWKWYGLTLLTIAGATIALFPLVGALEHLPSWEECRFKIVVDVDTPEGLKTASGVYQIKTNRIRLNERGLSGKERLAGGDFTLDLGDGRRAIVSIADGRNFVHYPMRAYGRINYLDGKTDHPVELLGKMRPKFYRADDPSREIQPDEFEAVFGPGVHLRRTWLAMTDDPVRE